MIAAAVTKSLRCRRRRTRLRSRVVGPLQPLRIGVLDLRRPRCPSATARCHSDRSRLDRPRRERVATVVDPAMLELCGLERRRPLAMAELLDVDVAAACGRNEDRRVDPARHRVERLPTRPVSAHRAHRPGGLSPGFQHAAGEVPRPGAHRLVHIGTVKCRIAPRGVGRSRRRGTDVPEPRVELAWATALHLGPRLERRTSCRGGAPLSGFELAAMSAGYEAACGAPGERLTEHTERLMPRSRRKRRPPVLSSSRRFSESGCRPPNSRRRASDTTSPCEASLGRCSRRAAPRTLSSKAATVAGRCDTGIASPRRSAHATAPRRFGVPSHPWRPCASRTRPGRAACSCSSRQRAW